MSMTCMIPLEADMLGATMFAVCPKISLISPCEFTVNVAPRRVVMVRVPRGGTTLFAARRPSATWYRSTFVTVPSPSRSSIAANGFSSPANPRKITKLINALSVGANTVYCSTPVKTPVSPVYSRAASSRVNCGFSASAEATTI